MGEDSFRPSRVILAEIKLNNAEVARLNALVRKYTRLKAELSKERESLKELINQLEKIIKETGGTREQILLLRNYRNREQELPELQKDNEENLSRTQQEYEVAIRLQQSLDKELQETLAYEAELKLRLQITIVEPRSATNTSLLPINGLNIPAGTPIEMLSYEGENYIKVGSIPEPLDKIEFKDIDYSKILIGSGGKVINVGFGDSSPAEFFTYHTMTYNYDVAVSTDTPFILFDDTYYHSDGSVWALVSNGLRPFPRA